jgi:hypothetical protein
MLILHVESPTLDGLKAAAIQALNLSFYGPETRGIPVYDAQPSASWRSYNDDTSFSGFRFDDTKCTITPEQAANYYTAAAEAKARFLAENPDEPEADAGDEVADNYETPATDPEPADEPAGDVAEASPFDLLQAALRRLVDAAGFGVAQETLTSLGAGKLVTMDPKDYPAAIAAFDAATVKALTDSAAADALVAA